MAWLDDRAWCHPKLVDLSDKAFRVYINGISYSSGMGLRGTLSISQQRLLGADNRIRLQLIKAGCWNESDDETVDINDWDEHNGKRDDRRQKDRKRKRDLRKFHRQSAGTSTGQSAGTSSGTSTLSAHVDGSEGSEGSDGSEEDQEPSFLPTSTKAGKDGRTENGEHQLPDPATLLKTVDA